MFFFFPDGIAPQGDIIIYQSDNDNMTTNVLFKDETFWMSQKEIALLFGVDRTVISKHLKNVFANQELDENSVCAKIAHTAEDGKTYQVIFYNLDAIIAVGYRVNSKEATRFRMWATDTLKEYIVKGFVLNDDMLKNGRQFGKDYFDELLARIKKYVHLNVDFIRRLQIFLHNVVMTTTKIVLKQSNFMLLFKINCIGLLPIKLQLKLLLIVQTITSPIWD